MTTGFASPAPASALGAFDVPLGFDFGVYLERGHVHVSRRRYLW